MKKAQYVVMLALLSVSAASPFDIPFFGKTKEKKTSLHADVHKHVKEIDNQIGRIRKERDGKRREIKRLQASMQRKQSDSEFNISRARREIELAENRLKTTRKQVIDRRNEAEKAEDPHMRNGLSLAARTLEASAHIAKGALKAGRLELAHMERIAFEPEQSSERGRITSLEEQASSMGTALDVLLASRDVIAKSTFAGESLDTTD